MAEIRELLQSAGIAIGEKALAGLNRYHELLLDWNQRMDLTSVSEEDMAARHFLDSLLPLREEGFIPESGRLIDVGTGAGFPGLPLAIARENLQVTLLEAQNKRCVFLKAVVDALGLQNVTILNERAEIAGQAAGHREQYDRAVARAVAPANVLCEYLLPFVKLGGKALFWKGPAVMGEKADGMAAAKKLGGQWIAIHEMQEPSSDSHHVLVEIDKIQKTLLQFPRKNGMPAKRPLKADNK